VCGAAAVAGKQREQAREVLRRFALSKHPKTLAPYQRCLRCNGSLEPVPKAEVLARLADEPLTLRYYHDFRRCTQCDRLYWLGTHFERLSARLAGILSSQ
jgi:uncharacterized protein with PIN domain